MTSLDHLEPAALWRLFAELSAIPRPSEQEEGVRRWLLALAAKRCWESAVDGAGNVVLRIPPTPGRERAPVVILQAHMDMVTIKEPGAVHNFDRDPIRLRVEERAGERIVTADGTTLGADNGIGLCAAIAAAAEATHGPLEILATVNEETGMSGAHGLDASLLTGRRLLNLDSEEDDALYIGCVGGASGWLHWQGTGAPPPEWLPVQFAVTGLRGGHSGLEIHETRGNSIQILARMLALLPRGRFALARFDGGSRTNAIPAEARALVLLAPEAQSLAARLAAAVEAEWRLVLGPNGAKLRCVQEAADQRPSAAFSTEASALILRTIGELPHGVLARDPGDPALLESSCNLATVRTSDEGGALRVQAEVSIRSLRAGRLVEAVAFLEREASRSGAGFRGKQRYPPWTPQPDSALLAAARRVYAARFAAEPRIAVIHGGLETGIIGASIPGMDMISFGPRIEEPHTPEERVYVASVAKFWNFLTAVLDELSRA